MFTLRVKSLVDGGVFQQKSRTRYEINDSGKNSRKSNSLHNIPYRK